MEGETFNLLIKIIVVVIIIAILYGFFFQPTQSTLKEMQVAIDFAEANEGKLHRIDLALNKDFGLKASTLDTRTRSIRFECSSSETCDSGKITITARTLFVSEQLLVDGYFRCKREVTINDCVIYLGETPAQLIITNVNSKENIRTGEEATLTFELTNIGRLDAVDIVYDIRIFQINKTEFDEELQLKESFTGGIEMLTANELGRVVYEFRINSGGEYVIKIEAEGDDSGKTSAEIKIIVTGAPNPSCIAVGQGETFLENGSCKTQHSCDGCDFGFECKLAWQKLGVTGITDVFPHEVYTETPSVDGSCN